MPHALDQQIKFETTTEVYTDIIHTQHRRLYNHTELNRPKINTIVVERFANQMYKKRPYHYYLPVWGWFMT